MGIDNNDDIAKMLGGKPKKDSNIVKMPEYKFSDLNKDNKTIEMKEIKFNAENLGNVEKTLSNVPPLLLFGIVAIIAANFTPYKFLFTIGFLLIIVGVFDKAISKEKKQIMKDKIKSWFKRK